MPHLEADWPRRLYSRTLIALPVAVAIWIPLLFGLVRIIRPLVEIAAGVILGNVVAGLVQTGPLEWVLQTNLAFADKPEQLYELPIQPQYFLLPFPLIWAAIWASTTTENRAFCLTVATAIGLVAALIPLLLQIIPAPAAAAHSIGLNAVVNKSIPLHVIVGPYKPAPLSLLQILSFGRTLVVYFNLFVLPPFLCILCSRLILRRRTNASRLSFRVKNARRSR